MAAIYRLQVFNSNGQGVITRSPNNIYGIYEEGDLVDLSVVASPGYTFQSWTIRPSGDVLSLSTSFTFTMPASDVFIWVVYQTAYVTPYSYGLKYYSEYCVKGGAKTTRLEIEEKDYAGSVTETEIGTDLVFRFGNNNSDIRETVIGSSIDFSLPVKQAGDFSEFLSSDIRKFRVNYYRGYVDASTYDFKWVGYLTTDVFEEPNRPFPYMIGLTATDGIKTLNMPLDINRVTSLRGANLLSSLLNQTFLDPLPITESINFYETRMTDTISVLHQFEINAQRLFKDDALYLADENGIEANPRISIKEAIERLLRPFVARVFQWDGFWRVIRMNEYFEDSFTEYVLDENGDPDGSSTIDNTTQVLDGCLFQDSSEVGEVGYSELNAVLKLGDINVPEKNELLNENFEFPSWDNFGGARYYLKRWQYIKSTVFDGNRGEEIARIEFITNQYDFEGQSGALFWGTANGTDDANISYIEFNSESKVVGSNLAQEDANTITIGASFMIANRSGDDPTIPPVGSHVVGLAVQINDLYLYETATPNVFDWTTTPNIVLFPCDNAFVLNKIEIPNVLVPEDGDINFRLYQLITVTGTRHRYMVLWEDAFVNLEKNDGLTNQEVVARAVTDIEYPSVAPDYELFIGDAFTVMSASAIILSDVTDAPVSEFWTRDGIESLDMLEIILRDLANLEGKNNFRIRGVYHGEISPLKTVITNSEKFFVNSFILNDWDNSFQIDLYKLE